MDDLLITLWNMNGVFSAEVGTIKDDWYHDVATLHCPTGYSMTEFIVYCVEYGWQNGKTITEIYYAEGRFTTV